jgi:hypothetical protein
MALTPFQLILRGAQGLVEQGKSFFNAPDNSTAGIIRNTITGIPQAAEDLRKKGQQTVGSFISPQRKFDITPQRRDIQLKDGRTIKEPEMLASIREQAEVPIIERLKDIPKATTEIATSFGRLGDIALQKQKELTGKDIIPGYSQFVNSFVKTKTGNVLSDILPKLEQYQTPSNIYQERSRRFTDVAGFLPIGSVKSLPSVLRNRSEEHTSELQSRPS